jgi:hypothetical protein
MTHSDATSRAALCVWHRTLGVCTTTVFLAIGHLHENLEFCRLACTTHDMILISCIWYHPLGLPDHSSHSHPKRRQRRTGGAQQTLSDPLSPATNPGKPLGFQYKLAMRTHRVRHIHPDTERQNKRGIWDMRAHTHTHTHTYRDRERARERERERERERIHFFQLHTFYAQAVQGHKKFLMNIN